MNKILIISLVVIVLIFMIIITIVITSSSSSPPPLPPSNDNLYQQNNTTQQVSQPYSPPPPPNLGCNDFNGTYTSLGERLNTNGALSMCKCLTSYNGAYKLLMQTNGKLVLYKVSNGAILWDASSQYFNSIKDGPYTAVMQGDGNFCVYAGNTPLFASNTSGSGFSLLLQNDSNLVIYDSNGKAVWGNGIKDKNI